MPDTPQAVIPRGIRSTHQLLRDQIVAQKLNIRPPVLAIANGQVLDAKAGCAIRYLQNCGNEAVKVAIGSVASAANFHFILAACSADDAGDGGSIDLSRYEGTVSIFSAGGAHRVSVFEALSPESFD